MKKRWNASICTVIFIYFLLQISTNQIFLQDRFSEGGGGQSFFSFQFILFLVWMPFYFIFYYWMFLLRKCVAISDLNNFQRCDYTIPQQQSVIHSRCVGSSKKIDGNSIQLIEKWLYVISFNCMCYTVDIKIWIIISIF